MDTVLNVFACVGPYVLLVALLFLGNWVQMALRIPEKKPGWLEMEPFFHRPTKHEEWLALLYSLIMVLALHLIL